MKVGLVATLLSAFLSTAALAIPVNIHYSGDLNFIAGSNPQNQVGDHFDISLSFDTANFNQTLSSTSATDAMAWYSGQATWSGFYGGQGISWTGTTDLFVDDGLPGVGFQDYFSFSAQLSPIERLVLNGGVSPPHPNVFSGTSILTAVSAIPNMNYFYTFHRTDEFANGPSSDYAWGSNVNPSNPHFNVAFSVPEPKLSGLLF